MIADESVHDHTPCQGCMHQAEHVFALAERLREAQATAANYMTKHDRVADERDALKEQLRAAETRQRLHDRVMESPKAQAAYARTTAEIETRHETAKVEAERDAYARAWDELREKLKRAGRRVSPRWDPLAQSAYRGAIHEVELLLLALESKHGIDTNNGSEGEG